MRALLAALLLAATPAAAEPFEHYVLALSWSPSFCATPAGDRERMQCGAAADHTFVVHGLWPNDEDADLANCRSRSEPSRRDIDAILDIMPSPGLARYQWRKHGTCSGLSPSEYFATVRAAFERVSLPPRLETLDTDLEARPDALLEAFLRANPGLEPDGIGFRCNGRRLREIRVCMTADLEFTTCPAGQAESCSARLVELPAPE